MTCRHRLPQKAGRGQSQVWFLSSWRPSIAVESSCPLWGITMASAGAQGSAKGCRQKLEIEFGAALQSRKVEGLSVLPGKAALPWSLLHIFIGVRRPFQQVLA